MSKYLKLFDNHVDYLDFKETTGFIFPNVSHCIDKNEVHYNPSPTPPSTKVFWRYHNTQDAYVLVDENGGMLVAEVSGTNWMFRCNSDGTFSDLEDVNNGIAQDWGVKEIFSFEGSIDADWRITVDGETVSYNGVLTPSVTEWVSK